MSLKTQQGKIRIKRSTITGDEPTLAPSSDHTDGTWSRVDCYSGELFLNIPDEKMWIMLDDGPRRIAMTDTTDDDCCVWVRDGEDIRTVENLDTSPVIYPNILPSADDMQDIGSATYRWKDLYLGSQINFVTDLDFVLGGVSPDQTIFKVDASGIEVQDGYFISGESNQAKIEFGTTGFERLYLTTDGGVGEKSWIDLNETTTHIGFYIPGEIGSSRLAFNDDGSMNMDGIVGTYQYVYAFQGSSGASWQVAESAGQISSKFIMRDQVIIMGLIDGVAAAADQGDGEVQIVFNRDADIDGNDIFNGTKKWPVIIGAQVQHIAQGVENAVALGGEGHYIMTDDVAYVTKIGHSPGAGSPLGSDQTIITFEFPTGSNVITVPNNGGTILLDNASTQLVLTGSRRETNITTVSGGGTTNAGTDDYIFYFTATGTLQLPAAASIGLGTIYRIFAGSGATVTVTPNGADNLDYAAASTTVNPTEMITIRALTSTDWMIGD